MKTSLLFALIFIPALGFGQVVDTAAVVREVDSLIDYGIQLRKAQRFDEAMLLGKEAAETAKTKLGNEHPKYARGLNFIGLCYFSMKLYNEAERFLVDAKNIRGKALGKNSIDYASSLHVLAILYKHRGEYDKAEPLYSEAKEIKFNILGNEHPEYAYLLSDFAVYYYEKGDYNKAEILWLESKEIQEKSTGKENLNYAFLLNNLANLYRVKGDYTKAEILLLEAKRILLIVLGKQNRYYSMFLNNLANVYYEKSDYINAKHLYLETIDIQENTLNQDPLDYAGSLNNLASLYFETGDYVEAEHLYSVVKEIRSDILGNKHPEYANSLDNLAIVYWRKGDYSNAEKLYSEAKEIKATVFGKEHPDYAQSLNRLAVLYMDKGDYVKAEGQYIEALDILAKTLGEEHPDYAWSLNSLAVLYMNKGNYDKAEPLFLRAIEIRAKSLGKEHPDYAGSLNDLALLYTEKGDYPKAEQLLLEATGIKATTLGKGHPRYANSLNNLTLLYMDKGDYAKAEPLLLETKEIRTRALGKEHPDYALSLHNLARLYQSQYQEEPAIAYSVMTNKAFCSLIEKTARYSSETEMLAYLHLYKEVFEQLYFFAQGNPNSQLTGVIFDDALFLNGFLLDNARRLVRSVANADSLTRDIYGRWQGCHRRLAKEYAKPIAERRYVAEVEAEAEGYEKTLTRNLPIFGEARRTIHWQEVRANLPPGSAAIEFIHYRYYNPQPTDSIFYSALVLRPGDSTPYFVPLFEERDITPLLQGASGDNVIKINALYTAPEANSNQKSLYDLIWKPLEKLLEGTNKVYCSPSGLLHRLNLGAIPVADGMTYTKRRPPVLLGSTRQLATDEISEKIHDPKTAALFGGIRYDSMAVISLEKADTSTYISAGTRSTTFIPGESSVTAWDYLQFSEQEVKNIQNDLTKAGYRPALFSGNEATEESFKTLGQKKPSPAILHVATHGFFFPDPKNTTGNRQWQFSEERQAVFKLSDNPMMRSGLILAGANRVWKGQAPMPGRDDGILTAYEISQMNLSNTELVVLSACETGLGDIEGNEGVYGLQRAFKIAGAKYLIMSLWQVNDLATQELMTDFYRQWLKNRLTIPDAFRAAQQHMQKKYPRDPYFWAGFVLIE